MKQKYLMAKKLETKIKAMSPNKKSEAVKNLKQKLEDINEELKMLDNSIDYVKHQTVYISESKKKIISLCIEVCCCVVGGVIGGFAPSLNIFYGIAYGFLISLPIELLSDINIETGFLKKLLNKMEIGFYNYRKNKLIKDRSKTEQYLESFNAKS